MSINVDDPGDQRLPEFPLVVHLAADTIDVADAIDQHHPDVAAEHATSAAEEALDRFGVAAASSGVPAEYLAALRDGHPRRRYRIPIAAGAVVSIAVAEPGPGRPPYNTCREVESWLQLRAVVADVNAGCDTTVLHPGLPHELAVAVWDLDGHRIYVARPGAPARSVRAARHRARWYSITSTPIAAAVAEKIAQFTATTGHVTVAASAAASALIVPALPAAPVPSPPTSIQAGDLFDRGHHIQPGLPVALKTPPAASLAPPRLTGDAATQDTQTDTDAPTTTEPTVTSATTAPTNTPSSPDPVPSVTSTPKRSAAPAPPAPVSEVPPVIKSAPADPGDPVATAPAPVSTSTGPPPQVKPSTKPARDKQQGHNRANRLNHGLPHDR